jgi:diguanylate cyclase (GGDEF)-like protein/PAS domain S-box-containing protein
LDAAAPNLEVIMINALMENKGIDFLRQILSGGNTPIIVTDALAPDHPVVFVNDAFERETGYSAAEATGRNCRFLQNGDRDQQAVQQLRQSINQGRPCDCVVRNYRKDGTAFWNQLYVYPVRGSNNVISHFVGIQRNVTTAHEAAKDLLELRAAFEHSLDVCLKLADDGTILRANQAVRTVFRDEPEAMVGTNWKSLLIGVDQQSDTSLLHMFTQMGLDQSLMLGRCRRTDGTAVEIEWSVSKIPMSSTLIAIGRDVTAKRLAVSEIRLANEKVRAILDSITEGFYSVDREWRFTYINEQGAKVLDRRAGQLIGKTVWDEFPAAVGGIFYKTYHRAMSTQIYAECDAYYPPLDRWLNARAYPSEEGLTVFLLDVSERKRDENDLLYAASHDELTGLINRHTCLQRLESTLALTAERVGPLAVLFMDLDRFKEVNDALGHRAGDQVLSLLAQRLRELSSQSQYCARLSGDEFLFVLEPCSVEQAQAFASCLLESIVRPFDIAGHLLTVGVSIGIAVVAQDETVSASDLVNRADTAMYSAKASGRLAVRVFAPESEQKSERRLQLRNDMGPAISAGQFVLHYQPQVRLDDGSVGGVEALIRWNHPSYGLLSPAAFLDIAEESPLILQLGAWVFDEACRQLAQWHLLGHRHLRVAVNVSARQLVDPNFPRLARLSVEKYALDPHCLEIEVTETMLAQDFKVSSNVLIQLARDGFGISLDDFGTGYSNLAYINRFPIMAIKIDRSFITDIVEDPKAIDLVKGIVALAKSLKLSVICEGVETKEQRSALEGTGCDLIQGYLISKPVPADVLFNRFL